MSATRPAAIVTTAVVFGSGLFVGELKDGQPFIYEGGVVRLARDDLGEDDNAVAAVVERLRHELASTFICVGDPVKGAPLETMGCLDPQTGDWLVLWRLACTEPCYDKRS